MATYVWTTTKAHAAAGESHSSPTQKWEVTASNGRVIAMEFAEFATKHFLKPSRKDGVSNEEKAERIRLKRLRDERVTKAHHAHKYGSTITGTNTMIDLSRVALPIVLSKFAEALSTRASEKDSRNRPVWGKDEDRVLTVDLRVADAVLISRPTGQQRARSSVISFKAKRGDNSNNGNTFSFKVFHLET